MRDDRREAEREEDRLRDLGRAWFAEARRQSAAEAAEVEAWARRRNRKPVAAGSDWLGADGDEGGGSDGGGD